MISHTSYLPIVSLEQVQVEEEEVEECRAEIVCRQGAIKRVLIEREKCFATYMAATSLYLQIKFHFSRGAIANRCTRPK